MAIVRGPVDVRVGSPDDERGRVPASDSPNEPLHSVHIGRSFAIGTKEVTVASFKRFLEANPVARQRHAYPGNPERMATVMRTFSPDPDGPQIAVTWYEAAMYCNWLSKQAGLPPSEWVYPDNPDRFADGLMLAADYLQRKGSAAHRGRVGVRGACRHGHLPLLRYR